MLNTGGFNTTSFQQYGSTSNAPAGKTSRNLGPEVVPSLSTADGSFDDDEVFTRPRGRTMIWSH